MASKEAGDDIHVPCCRFTGSSIHRLSSTFPLLSVRRKDSKLISWITRRAARSSSCCWYRAESCSLVLWLQGSLKVDSQPRCNGVSFTSEQPQLWSTFLWFGRRRAIKARKPHLLSSVFQYLYDPFYLRTVGCWQGYIGGETLLLGIHRKSLQLEVFFPFWL